MSYQKYLENDNPLGQLAWIVPRNPDSNMSKELYFRPDRSSQWQHYSAVFPEMGPPKLSPGYGVFCQLIKRKWQVVQASEIPSWQVNHPKSSKEQTNEDSNH